MAVGKVPSPFFARSYPVVPAPFVEKTILATLNGFGTSVENHLTIYMQFISGLDILFY